MRVKRSIIAKMKVRDSLILYMSLFVIMPLCVVIAVMGALINSYINQKTISNNESLVLQIATNADQLIEVVNYATSMFMVDTETFDNLRTLGAAIDDYDIYKLRSRISKQIGAVENSIMNAVKGKMAILTTNGYMISPANISKTSRDYSLEDWYKQTLDNGRRITYSPDIAKVFRENPTFRDSYPEYRYLYYARTVLDYNGNTLGLIVAQISAEKIWANYLNANLANQGARLYLLNNSGELQMCSGDSSDLKYKAIAGLTELLGLEKNESAYGVTGDGCYYRALRLQNSPNILIFMEDYATLFSGDKSISVILWLSIAVVIILILCILMLLARKITTPLSALVEEMDKEPEGPISLNGGSSFIELDNFIQSYNRAWQRVMQLLTQVREQTHLREKAYYEMLISQISPHFICNTVNSIKYMAAESKDSMTVEALDALGDILQSVYDNDSDITLIAKEAQLLAAYVKIMRMRFGFNFQYIENIPAELYMCKMPAFTLQPLVENAILHGVRDKRAGQIIVNAEAIGGEVRISVFNNGESVDIEKIKLLLTEGKRDRSQFCGIGLNNINSRIKLLYGSKYGLSVNESINSGFEIVVRIPREEGYLNDKGIDR